MLSRALYSPADFLVELFQILLAWQQSSAQTPLDHWAQPSPVCRGYEADRLVVFSATPNPGVPGARFEIAKVGAEG